MPPKKFKKKVVKRSITVQGINIQGSNNLIRGALVENNTAESGKVEKELIIQGFNLSENSNNNVLEDILARNNQVIAVSYESESDSDKADELKEKKCQLKKDEKELKKMFEELGLGLNNIENIFKEKQKGNNKKTQIDNYKPTLESLIGKGGYSEVYRGKWKFQDVAVKKLYLSPNSTSESDIKSIKREINILKSLRNRYIIQYYGVYFDNQEFLIIMDHAENGTLTRFINDNKDKEHNWKLNNELIGQMALGLTYIHQEKIIHRDLKSMNILLVHDYQVKISDFGLSRVKDISFSQSKDMKGTLGWMAPELLRGEKYSEQSDIYSLGVVIWEIVSKCTAPGVSKGEIPSETPQSIQDLIQQCWKDNPKERISLKEILEIIKGSTKNSSKPQKYKEINEQFLNPKQNNIPESVQFDMSGVKVSEEQAKQLTVEDWTNINPNFTKELIQQWTNHNFTPSQVRDWINTGLQPTDHHFASYLRNKNLTPEEVLNKGSEIELREEFQTYQEQLAQIEQPPK